MHTPAWCRHLLAIKKSSIDTMSIIKCDRPGPARSGVKKGFSTIMDSTEAASWSNCQGSFNPFDLHPPWSATIRTLHRGGIAGDPPPVIGEIPCYAHPCWAGARVCSLRTAMVSIDITSSKKRFSLKPIREPVRVVWECLNDVLLNPYTQSNTHIMSHTTRHNITYYCSGQWTNQKHCLAICKSYL